MSSKLSISIMNNYVNDFFKVKMGKDPLKPLFFSVYTNMLCNFNCSYCDYAQTGQTRKPDNQLDTYNTFKLLRIIRDSCANIYFTGGEPLLRNDLNDILKESKILKFKSITVNTNMSLIHKKLEILDNITELVASFDCVDDERNSILWGVNKNIAKQVKDNIILCSKLQKEKKFTMTINCVVTEKNISDVYNVLDFCLRYGIKFAIVPAEEKNGEINKKLINNKQYKALIEHIKKTKETNKLIFGSIKYLDTIINFKPFDCFPTLNPHVYPNGDLFYPCQPMLKVASNLLKTKSYEKSLNEGLKKFGKLPMCKNKCYKACYIEPSNFIKNPFLIIKELL